MDIKGKSDEESCMETDWGAKIEAALCFSVKALHKHKRWKTEALTTLKRDIALSQTPLIHDDFQSTIVRPEKENLNISNP